MKSEAAKVVVTGGAGFIGSHLSARLAAEGFHVTVLDNLATGSLENIEQLLEKPAAKFVRGSITDLPLLRKTFKGARYIFHHAAVSSVPWSIDDPLAANEVNVNGTLNVLLAARDSGVAKVISASSAAVYGDNPSLPLKEDMPPRPLSPYAVNKLTGEYYCDVFQRAYGLPTVSLRYFNVYGPRQDPASQYAAVIPRFVESASAGRPPVIFGDGEQTRDFIYVRDVVEANLVAARGDASGVLNIAGAESISINSLARLIIKLSGKRLEPVHEPARPGDIRHSLADISRAKTFGITPGYGLEAGLKETIKSFQVKN